MGTCIYETISNDQTESSEYEKESSFIFVIAALFALLWVATGFTGVIAFSCATIAIILAISGTTMTLVNKSRSSVADN